MHRLSTNTISVIFILSVIFYLSVLIFFPKRTRHSKVASASSLSNQGWARLKPEPGTPSRSPAFFIIAASCPGPALNRKRGGRTQSWCSHPARECPRQHLMLLCCTAVPSASLHQELEHLWICTAMGDGVSWTRSPRRKYRASIF